MSKTFESIKRGLGEAIQFAKGKPSKAVVHDLDAVDIKFIRSRVGMTQEQFAMTFGISVSTLRHWERGDRSPAGPALVLLNVMGKEPKAVLRALSQ
jgi:putative transcriptional regulator